MNHADHVDLLREAVLNSGLEWADLGSGTGSFTLALADLLGPSGRIYSVDKDRGALREQERFMRARFPALAVTYIAGDFMRPLDLPPLDGIVMANALHFIADRDKTAVMQRITGYLRPGGRFVLVEYDVDHGNAWVPYPLTHQTWVELAGRCGLVEVRLVGQKPSRFLGRIYSAVGLTATRP